MRASFTWLLPWQDWLEGWAQLGRLGLSLHVAAARGASNRLARLLSWRLRAPQSAKATKVS